MTVTGATILGCAGPALTAPEAAFFKAVQPWGFILFSRNIVNPDQVRRLTAALRDSVGREAPILIDQEGGRVQRLRPPHWRDWLPPLDQVARVGPEAAARSMYLRARIIADELHRLGIDVNCAPSGDVAQPETHRFLRDRCYGTEPETVAEIALATARGLMDGGVLPVIKHLPGHGRGTRDSHLALPVVDAPRAALEAVDFLPFRRMSNLPMAMTAHVVFSDIDPTPATHSPKMIGLIREALEFDGLLMTDDISMEALGGPVGLRASAAMAAGCDVVLHCNGDLAEMRAVAEASGPMGVRSAERAASALARRSAPDGIDIADATAEL
ncbi:hypothetical protein LCGC14_2701350, partial [marine sediment metagenome]